MLVYRVLKRKISVTLAMTISTLKTGSLRNIKNRQKQEHNITKYNCSKECLVCPKLHTTLSIVKINEYVMQKFTCTTDETAQGLLDFPQGHAVSNPLTRSCKQCPQSKSKSHPQLYQC